VDEVSLSLSLSLSLYVYVNAPVLSARCWSSWTLSNP
jgi:hypothetical protein